jgi:peptidoglycan/LPS O-acetylase OafA/YrhL
MARMSSGENVKLKAHIDRLDVLRAISFLTVYSFHLAARFRHANVPFTDGMFRDYSVWPKDALFLVPAGFGWIGVAFFYVLSGFCIHYATLHRREKFNIRDFYGRRFLRIYPAYIVVVLVCTALAPWLPYHYFNAGQVMAHVFMVHNFLKSTIFGLDGVLWSLGVEMQFYLLYPLLLSLARRWGGVERCLVMGLVLNVLAQLYIGFIKHNGWNPVSVTWSFPLVTWCDWILGVCVAQAYVEGRRLFKAEARWLVFSAVMLVAALNFRILCSQGFLFGSVFFAVVLQRYLAVRAPLQWFERALIPVGVISYSLYLWHEPLMMLINQAGMKLNVFVAPWAHVAWDVVVTSVLLTLIAGASYYFLEVGAPKAIRQFMTRKHLHAPPLPGPADSPLLRQES